MPKLMMTVRLDPKEASVAAVTRKLKLRKGEVDEGFGVVSIDPDKKLFAILVDEDVASKLQGHAAVRGPFANPKIEPFGPPTK